tara:strand:- start:909 stop:1211 length:303 start_codon:yes stop_codon:yes gene_type:complete
MNGSINDNQDIMNYNIGDFIITDASLYPALIVDKNNQASYFLISIKEYNGDYKWLDPHLIIQLADIKSEEKLSILASFGNWFYQQHKLLYQQLIIENLIS